MCPTSRPNVGVRALFIYYDYGSYSWTSLRVRIQINDLINCSCSITNTYHILRSSVRIQMRKSWSPTVQLYLRCKCFIHTYLEERIIRDTIPTDIPRGKYSFFLMKSFVSIWAPAFVRWAMAGQRAGGALITIDSTMAPNRELSLIGWTGGQNYCIAVPPWREETGRTDDYLVALLSSRF